MMKKWLLAAGCMMLSWAGHAQVSNPQIVSVASAPSGSCSVTFPLQLKTPDGTLYSCQGGTWGQMGGGGGATLAGDVTGPANANTLDLTKTHTWTGAQTFNSLSQFTGGSATGGLLQVTTPGVANNQLAGLNIVTLSDGSALGTATNKGWEFLGEGNTFTGCNNCLRLSYWNGTSLTPVLLFNSSQVPSFGLAFGNRTYTVGTLPAASIGAGVQAVVTDATTFTVGACVGGGSDTMIAVSNGTTWTCH